ncbi:DHH family phosphoesterase [Paenibacillus melissococcoides]|uniref:Cyclic-di-AMP phosphodiesterase n=1 Tax=Paenibacillus melissococcoides TaxID=2912268 RepID=A0ABM9G747_9BACL|nr:MULTISPECIES: DHH family phosphoesterase [Paenibacillus]MEB9893628.1 DHH family phosphoesterase [Bacillus cereus]CAH8247723.1 DHH family phosphoesterase [Paenibacillus melissococcoides]CAH8705773.1 DHH family phosphoesterase [Paenibacillus melissococcoides]CAH8715246.1 DHH family phosphoesterase [Paenibacillus melissococcoides]GIO80354.1 DHH family phosphoesterase [Paenibacillus dendritiformis]
MPKMLFQRWYFKHIIWMFVLLVVVTGVLAYYNWMVGLLAFAGIAALAVASLAAERKFRQETELYLTTLGLRVKRAGESAIVDLPYGILLYSENRTIEWHNPYVAQLVEQDGLVGDELGEVFPQLQTGKDLEHSQELFIGGRIVHADIVPGERVVYFTDITDIWTLRKRYEEERIAVGTVIMDNLEESTQGMEDQQRTGLIARVAGQITEWAAENGILIRRLSSERYFLVMDVQTLKALEQTRFVILDEVREVLFGNKLPVTLSMGIAAGADSIAELGRMAQSSLDIALGRGGDQVAVRMGQRLSFYGGKSNAVEKRTRVRARVIAHALRDFIQQSDAVFIMGHKVPDTDAIGSAIGVLHACRMLEVEAYIVLEDSNPSIDRMVDQLRKDEILWSRFITRGEAVEMITEASLVVVVDTHKASLVEEPKLLRSERIVVIDHHRRGEEFINDAVLVYLEPYASSTAELVTELLQYIQNRINLSMLEATALLAGITVDTKHFTLRTGSRTFDAASFLRRQGADPLLVQRVLKQDLDEYIEKAEIIRRAEMLYGHIALAVTEPGRKYSQLLIAQAADTLLNMTDVLASFVISERPDGLIGISARSLGQMNVQVVMERLGGGGHLTNAAVQLACPLEEAEAKLRRVLEEIDAEEGLFE